MPDVIEAVSYEAVLAGPNDREQVKSFARLTDAILWVSGQCNADNDLHGVVRFKGEVLWRKRTVASLPNAPPLAPDSPEGASAEGERGNDNSVDPT